MIEKYGFVYIWFDRKRKMYYIGCHWGTVDDGYICSSNRMRDAYRRRPQDFKRRILEKCLDKALLLEKEHQWLSMITDVELGNKYYNLRKHKWGHWSTNDQKRMTISQKVSEHQKKLVEEGKHFLQSEKHPGKKMIADGTHLWLSEKHKERTRHIQNQRVEDGTHPWIDSELHVRTNEKRIKQGTHNFLLNNRSNIDEKRCATWQITFPDGKVVVIKNLKKFCKEYNLNQGAMNQVGLGKKEHHKMFKCIKLENGLIRGKTMSMENK